MKYFYALIVIILGFLLVRYSNWLVNNFGYVDWAEHYLGVYGGTRLMWKIIGILFIIGALFTVSGIMENILYSIFGRMVGGL